MKPCNRAQTEQPTKLQALLSFIADCRGPKSLSEARSLFGLPHSCIRFILLLFVGRGRRTRKGTRIIVDRHG
jgi:hypothetical protein